jgi:hypothetical protein
MSEPQKKNRLQLSGRARTIVALAVIALLVVIVIFFVPREQDSTIVVGDTVGPTVTAKNLVSTLTVNRSIDYNSVQYTVATVSLASSFSDDHKPQGTYTVRVAMEARSDSSLQEPLGIDYSSLVRLILPEGQFISPKLVSLSPLILPGGSQSGYFDFPINTQVDLSTLMLKMGNEKTVAFG